jgi:hypothetical protein
LYKGCSGGLCKKVPFLHSSLELGFWNRIDLDKRISRER